MPRPTRFLLSLSAMAVCVTSPLAESRAQQTPDAQGTIAFDPAQKIPRVRVLLTTCSSNEPWDVRTDGPYRLVSSSDPSKVLVEGKKLAKAQVATNDRRWLTFPGVSTGHQSFYLESERDGTIWIGDRCYRGRIRFTHGPRGYIEVVNEVELEDYLASVISCEMPATFPPAAQQAQVIAARTYALFHMLTRGETHRFDVFDSSRSQNYRGTQYVDARGRRLAAETAGSREVVRATDRAVLIYQGRLFCSYYSATCGGQTADGRSVFGQAPPPLTGRASDFCRDAPNYHWTRRVSKDLVLGWLNFEPNSRLKDIVEITSENTALGLVPRFRFGDGSNEREILATHLKGRLAESDIPSPHFTAKLVGDEVVFEGRGWGHGVGLCQWGSKTLAEQGRTSEDILAHYYPGSTLVRIE